MRLHCLASTSLACAAAALVALAPPAALASRRPPKAAPAEPPPPPPPPPPQDNDPPTITPVPFEFPAEGAPLTILCDIADASPLFEPALYWRVAGGEFNAVPLKVTAGPRHVAEFAPPKGSKSIEYYLEAFDQNGNGPARIGSPQLPLTQSLVPPPPPEPPPAPPEPFSPLPGVVAASAGGLGIVIGAAMGALALGAKSDFAGTYDPARRVALANAARGNAFAADLSYGFGAVALGAGAALLWLASQPPPLPGGGGGLIWIVAPGAIGVAGVLP